MNATIKLEKNHFPVLLDELISIISPLYGGTFIDCTFGQGGYSKKILENKKNEVIAIDRDATTEKLANEFKEKYKNRFYFENIRFSEINKLKLNFQNLSGIIFDLGYSLNQIKDYNRGLSFNSTGKLNMKLTIDSPYIRFLNSARGSGKVDIYELFGLIKNDFLPVVEARYPSTERILSVLRGGGAKVASMSGTGSTLYGGFALESDALSTIEHLRSLGYPARFCRPVRRQVQ